MALQSLGKRSTRSSFCQPTSENALGREQDAEDQKGEPEKEFSYLADQEDEQEDDQEHDDVSEDDDVDDATDTEFDASLGEAQQEKKSDGGEAKEKHGKRMFNRNYSDDSSDSDSSDSDSSEEIVSVEEEVLEEEEEVPEEEVIVLEGSAIDQDSLSKAQEAKTAFENERDSDVDGEFEEKEGKRDRSDDSDSSCMSDIVRSEPADTWQVLDLRGEAGTDESSPRKRKATGNRQIAKRRNSGVIDEDSVAPRDNTNSNPSAHSLPAYRDDEYTDVRYDVQTGWRVRDGDGAVSRISEAVLRDDCKEWFVDCVCANPGFWLPIGGEGKFSALQAPPTEEGHWYGILDGGAHVQLPYDYLQMIYTGPLLARCKESAPRSVDCTNVGRAAPGPPRGKRGTPASTAVDVGHCHRFPSDGLDTGVAYTAAAAVDFTDKATADHIAALAIPSLRLPCGVNRVRWVMERCVETLRWTWVTRSVKSAHLLTTEDVLATPAAGQAIVYQIKDSSGYIDHCVAKAVDSHGRGWLCDMNQGYVPLTTEGLDACCISDATFVGIVRCFSLTKLPEQIAKRPKETAEPPPAKPPPAEPPPTKPLPVEPPHDECRSIYRKEGGVLVIGDRNTSLPDALCNLLGIDDPEEVERMRERIPNTRFAAAKAVLHTYHYSLTPVTAQYTKSGGLEYRLLQQTDRRLVVQMKVSYKAPGGKDQGPSLHCVAYDGSTVRNNNQYSKVITDSDRASVAGARKVFASLYPTMEVRVTNVHELVDQNCGIAVIDKDILSQAQAVKTAFENERDSDADDEFKKEKEGKRDRSDDSDSSSMSDLPLNVRPKPATKLVIGDKLEAHTCSMWHAGKVVDLRGQAGGREAKVHFLGWNTRWDEWVGAGRLRATGGRSPMQFY